MFKRFSKSIASTYKLQRKYYLLTSGLGFVVLAVGFPLLAVLMYATSTALGLPMNGGTPLDGIRFLFITWLVIIFLSIPIIFYFSMILVAGLFSVLMVAMGRFSVSEAKAYTFFSEYPQHWYEEET